MKISKPKIILDTNIVLVSILPHHKYHWVYQQFLKKEYILYISNEILNEYYEKLLEKFGLNIANSTLDLIIVSPNIEKIEPSFRFLLIKDDPDDDKFVDCAIAGNVDFIVTHDKHFNVLKDIPFPKVETLKIDEFKDILDNWTKEAFE